jgi:hypothetical protein
MTGEEIYKVSYNGNCKLRCYILLNMYIYSIILNYHGAKKKSLTAF